LIAEVDALTGELDNHLVTRSGWRAWRRPGRVSFCGPRVDLAAIRSAGSASRTLPGPGSSRRTQPASKNRPR
jgi:hypothetical protein